MAKKNQKKEIIIKARPPVVVVLGHVDHGKTTLLDFIKKTKVTESEAGGITQHIGAYQIEHNSKKITFIDTPGHEAFGKMRLRGAKVADIAVLVVAAEEGIKPQTIESIKYINEAQIPFVVALNKIDKPEANIEKTKKELSEHNVLIEEWGGKIPLIPVSAKTGQGISDLLEMILLVAEMEELESDEDKSFEGIVIESFMDKERGSTATMVVKKGKIKLGDKIYCGKTRGVVKIIEDFQGHQASEAGPSTPVRILGMETTPDAGEKCFIDDGKIFRQVEEKIEKPMIVIGESKSPKTLHLVIKADTHGSLEAIIAALQSIKSLEVAMEILKADVGEINETDVKTARASGAIIALFNLNIPRPMADLAERNGLIILSSAIIYELIDKIRNAMSFMLETETVKTKIGQLKVMAIFRTEKQRMIIGGKITNGFLRNRAEAEITRNGQAITKGRIIQLKRDKQNVEQMEKPGECGILFEGEPLIREGDVLEAYIEEKVKKNL